MIDFGYVIGVDWVKIGLWLVEWEVDCWSEFIVLSGGGCCLWENKSLVFDSSIFDQKERELIPDLDNLIIWLFLDRKGY